MSCTTETIALLDPYTLFQTRGKGKPKNDVLDSQAIAAYTIRYQDQLRPWIPHEAIVEEIKTLLATREQLVQQKTATQNARTALKRKPRPTLGAIEVLTQTTHHLAGQIKELESLIRDRIASHPSTAQMIALVTSVPGVGLLLGAHMLVLSNNFTELLSYRQLAQYLGISPNEYRSGTSVYRRPRSRRYGPAMVRKLLHLAALSLRTHDPGYQHYFFRKVAQGKNKQLVLNNMANKLLKVLCSIIKNKRPYNKGYLSIQPSLLKP